MEVYLLWGSFELESGPICSSRPTSSITKVLTDVHENFKEKHDEISNHQKFINYNTRNRQNGGLPALGLVWTWKWVDLLVETTSSITKVLTNVHEKFR